ncbi:unnamed protein product, partial [Menidia menidia]
SEFAVGVIGKFIYAVAGRTRDETFYSTERYDITEDRWEFVEPYPVNKYGHEGTVLNGKLYITGGITSSSTSKQVCVFDPGRETAVSVSVSVSSDPLRRGVRGSTAPPGGCGVVGGTHSGCWENKSKMNYARCFHKMISHNGKLYVFGGVCVVLRASFESQGCPSTEVYDPAADEWTILASMPIGRSGHGVAVLGGQIMVLGGLCYNGHYSDSILTFDPEENKWKEDEFPRMPCKLDGLQVCSLHFPEYVLEHSEAVEPARYPQCLALPSQVKTSEFYRYSRQLRQEVDQALSYFHDVNQQPLEETRSNRIRSVRPQTAVFRGMIGHSMVNSKILLLQRPKVCVCMCVWGGINRDVGFIHKKTKKKKS